MSSLKLGLEDSSDLKRVTQYLAHKAAQIIVQSRCGITFNTVCKRVKEAKNDWFNLDIQDMREITKIMNYVLCEDLISSSKSLCIEISVKTVDRNSMILENWCFGVKPGLKDPNAKISDSSVYIGMGNMLKSLLTISRMMPAYHISRRQDSDSYIIYYRISLDESCINRSDKYKYLNVGQVDTSVGTICTTVAYRTSVVIPPRPLSLPNAVPSKKSIPSNKIETEACGSEKWSPLKNWNENSNNKIRNNYTMKNVNEDTLTEGMKIPFATISNNSSETPHLHQSCQSVLQSQADVKDQTIEGQIGDLTKLIETLETNVHRYENL